MTLTDKGAAPCPPVTDPEAAAQLLGPDVRYVTKLVRVRDELLTRHQFVRPFPVYPPDRPPYEYPKVIGSGWTIGEAYAMARAATH